MLSISIYLLLLVIPCNSRETLSLKHHSSSFSRLSVLSHLLPATDISYPSNHLRINQQCQMKVSNSKSWCHWGWSLIHTKLPFRRASSSVSNNHRIVATKSRLSSSLLPRVSDDCLERRGLFQLSWPSTLLRGISATVASCFFFGRSQVSHASGGFISDSGSSALRSSMSPIQVLFIWGGLFLVSALMHAAESAITKLSVWQLQELAESDGASSPFAALLQPRTLTQLLITMLMATTASGIYSTALFVAAASQLFPGLSLGTITAALTVVTLFFGELLPKALAVNHSELVARRLLPIVWRTALVLRPLTAVITALSEAFLTLLGLGQQAGESLSFAVSEDMLRRVVDEAQRSKRGIDSGEGRMIKGVLDMQDKEVGRIMQPRVEVSALPESSSARELLKAAVETKYSRIPVYRGGIDDIVGIVFAKDLLDHIDIDSDSNQDSTKTTHSGISGGSKWDRLTAKELMEPAYFIPETMSCWAALQSMKKQRRHMAVVVDEYGGTAGIVTFEDILEEVVGEIYDEDDDRDEQEDDWTILRRDDSTFAMKAAAELDDVCEALGLRPDLQTAAEQHLLQQQQLQLQQQQQQQQNQLGEEQRGSIDSDYSGSGYEEGRSYDNDFDPNNSNNNNNNGKVMITDEDLEAVTTAVEQLRRGEFSTLGGLLCAIAGRIPQEGDALRFAGYRFTIGKVEDSRRIVDILVTADSTYNNSNHAASFIGSGPSVSSAMNTGKKNSRNNAIINNHNNDGDESALHAADGDRDPVALKQSAIDITSNDQSQRDNIVDDDSPLSTGSKVKYDSRTDRFLVFRDGEWVDPDTL